MLRTVDVLCPGCLAPQRLAGFCARCGVVLAPDGIACTEVLGTPSPTRVSLRGTKSGVGFVVRLQRLHGDNPEAQRKRAKQLARFAEVPDVVGWNLASIAQRDGAPHWVLTRRWVEGTGLGTLCATAHPGDEAVVEHLARWLRALDRALVHGGLGVHLAHHPDNLIVTDDGIAVVDLALEGGPARFLVEQSPALADMIAAVVRGEGAAKLPRFLQRLRDGGYSDANGVTSALRHALGLAAPRRERAPVVTQAPAPQGSSSPEPPPPPRARAPQPPSPAAGERVIEMTWTCSSCAHRNLGRHKTCATCGSPKDASESYEMPADPSTAASVTEAALVRMALDGPDWRCAYCGSDQRRADRGCARCGASAVEGAEVTEHAHTPADEDPAGWGPAREARAWHRPWWVRALLAVAAVAVLALGARAWSRRARDLDALVVARAWRHEVQVERWAVRAREGFAENRPPDALDELALGPRVHHHERVLDGYDTQHYTERVLDGYTSESYSAQVACGQDCTTTAQSCRERCSSNRNGFATCRTVCSGGGQSCRTRYCSESRTRQVPRYRNEPRTRQVPRYRSEPRYAEAYRWHLWAWGPQRALVQRGTDDAPRWPADDEVSLGRALGERERERATRSATYEVRVRDEDATTWRITPATEAEFIPFAPRSTHRVHREAGRVTVDGRSWPGLP
jgi:hypothetical protein